jgi:hypothetical protein
VLEVKGTLEELRELFIASAVSEAKSTAKRAGKKVVKKVVKKSLNAWQRFLRDFKFRKQKRNEKSSTYFGLRTKAASRAYKRRGKK